MKKEIFIQSLLLTLVCAVFFMGFYTLFILGIAQFAPNRGNGEILHEDGKIYFTNVGQRFTHNEYFNSRPSAVDYNAAGAAGSNKGPANPDYLKTVQERIDTFLMRNPGVHKASIPSEMVTASGSGLDPDISVMTALLQVKRIATVRHLSETSIMSLIENNTERPFLGIFGPEKINLLKLNIALDNLQ